MSCLVFSLLKLFCCYYIWQMPHENVTFPVVVAKPAEACTPLENDVRGKVVLVRRGSCPFVKKAEEVQAAGGRVMVVGSLSPYILRMVSMRTFS